MHWELIVTVIIVRCAFQFYRASQKLVYRFPNEFEEVIKIIKDTPNTYIQYPRCVYDHLFEVNFDITLYTGKAKGRARLNFEQKKLMLRITYPFLIPENQMESCDEFIDITNNNINISMFGFELNKKTKLISFVFGIDFEPGIGVLPPYSEHILGYATMQMNHFLTGVQQITLNGMASEDAAFRYSDSKLKAFKNKIYPIVHDRSL